MKMLGFLIIFILNASLINAAKLLVFSLSCSKSHMMSQGRLADALVMAGHNVVSFFFL